MIYFLDYKMDNDLIILNSGVYNRYTKIGSAI